jgi:hypothetical protein
MLPRRGVAALQGCGLHAASRGIVTSAEPPVPFSTTCRATRISQPPKPPFTPISAFAKRPLRDDVRRELASSRRDIMPSFPQFNPLRLRSYVFRLPLCTRLLLTVMVALWAATIPFKGLRGFACLEPDKVNFGTSE